MLVLGRNKEQGSFSPEFLKRNSVVVLNNEQAIQ